MQKDRLAAVCIRWNYATRPYVLKSYSEDIRDSRYARRLKKILSKYQHQVSIKERTNGSLYVD